MGAKFSFRCPSCAYAAEVSGGDDVGMMVRTTTILCADCRELHDVVTGESLASASPSPRQTPLRCPVAAEHAVSRWRHPGPCPRCGTTLHRLGLALFWD
ncbi:MAG: hypothetical protein ACYC4L_20855 [Chloroflexota bacterium]